jgi:hypothetical protein
MKRTWITAIVALLVGVGAGFGLGRITAPGLSASRLGALAVGALGEGAPGAPLAPIDPEAALRVRSIAREALDWGVDPQRVVGSVVDQMGDDELIALVTSLTDYDREELEAIGDMRAFVRRLAEVAMEGSVVPAEEPRAGVARVDFAVEVLNDNSVEVPVNRFRTNDERIYATFPSGRINEDRVLAKWTRVEDGEVLLLGRYGINSQDDWSYVWLGSPQNGWMPGEYRVDFYTADDRLDLLASGNHVIHK